MPKSRLSHAMNVLRNEPNMLRMNCSLQVERRQHCMLALTINVSIEDESANGTN